MYICTHGTYVWHIRSCKQGFSHMCPIFPNDGGTRVSSRGPHPLSEALRDLGRLALENLLRWGIEDIRFGPCTGIFRMRICMQFHANIGNVYNSLSGFIMIYLVTYWLPTFQQSHRHGTSSADIFPGKIRGGSHPSTPPWPEANLPTWLTAESALLRSHSSIVKKIADVWQTRATLAPKSEVIRSKKKHWTCQSFNFGHDCFFQYYFWMEKSCRAFCSAGRDWIGFHPAIAAEAWAKAKAVGISSWTNVN